jgi:anthranilate phosphoribosyltransferase
MNIQKLTLRLLDGESIDEQETEITGAADEMMSGAASPVQMAAFLTALRARGETPRVLAAFARVMRERAAGFSPPEGTVLDTCGTGGDHSGTFNISTTAAFVAAGAGVKVAKHGNRSMTSKCGSSDVLSELGINIEADSALMERALRDVGICFLHAQQYHGSMRHVAPVRRELGFRTIFNLLGPLSNPAAASHQLLGVFGRKEAHLVAQVLCLLDTKGALVVHGSDGLDEITLTGNTYAWRVVDHRLEEILINPHLLGFDLASKEDLLGGDAAENARTLVEILSGADGPKRDIVLLNAGAAILVAGMAETLGEGVEKARESISSGAALKCLNGLQNLFKEASQ